MGTFFILNRPKVLPRATVWDTSDLIDQKVLQQSFSNCWKKLYLKKLYTKNIGKY